MMKILVTGGGTGGHIYPALALIRYIKQQQADAEFLYVGTENGLEKTIVPPTGIPFQTIEIQGFRRSLSLQNFRTIYLFLRSLKAAKHILKTYQPDIVIGTGGYVSGSVVYAASQLRIPTIIHEQNSIPGVTNKFLSRYASKVAISFPDAAAHFPQEKIVLTGNPRAQEVATIGASNVLTEYGLGADKRTVVLFGGSRGALRINQAFTEAALDFEDKAYQVLYASGARYYEELQQTLQKMAHPLANVSVQPYIENMAEVLASADLVVARAGATSIAEFTALGLPTILVPSPYVTNDHQTKNAQALVKAGAARMIADQELNGKTLIQTIDEILEDDTYHQQMKQAAKQEGIPDANNRFYALIQTLVK